MFHESNAANCSLHFPQSSLYPALIPISDIQRNIDSIHLSLLLEGKERKETRLSLFGTAKTVYGW
jgi:hypothetical protein